MEDQNKCCKNKWVLLVVALLIIFGGSILFYTQTAVSGTKCEAAKHLKSPEEAGDCYTCHLKTTPKIAQDWFESKHGVMLVKCFVCHGLPDGTGSIEYSANPDPNYICRRCHDPAVTMMEKKFGMRAECNDCHKYHSNSVHHDAYSTTESKKKMDQ
ncbi:MAG: hypothetical protein OCC46_10745 [Pseudodesulfovibrio sp.]